MADSDTSKLRVLLAGAGGFAREHLERLTNQHDVLIAGVADPNPIALAEVRARYGIERGFSAPAEMLKRVAADAIVVATPTITHVDISLQAVARRIDVLLEKPVAADAQGATILAAAAQRAGVLVLPGHVLRFSRDHQKVVEIVRSGAVGRLLYVNSRRYRDDSHGSRYADTDPVLMTLIHDVDLALWIAGASFHSVSATRTGQGLRSITAVAAETCEGVRCDLRTAWTFRTGQLPPDRIEVVGDCGSVELTVGEGLSLFAEGRREVLPTVVADDPLRTEQQHFLSLIRDRAMKPALTLNDALIGLRVADAIHEALATGFKVTIAP